jgi:membrane protein DedA with SNARE-associated domain
MADGAELPIDAASEVAEPDAPESDTSETEAGTNETVRPIDRTGIVLFAVPMAVTTILAWAGDAFAPSLIPNDKDPGVGQAIVLILLNPRLRNLVLVAPTMAAAPFILIAAFRLILIDPFFYWFGRRYGDVAIRWMEDKLGPGASIVLWLERFFAKTSYVAVALLPNQWICLLAGATRMKVWVFVLLNGGGTFARVILIWYLGDQFSDPILSFNNWIGEHRLQLTALTFTIVAVAVWRSTRKGRKQIESPSDILQELEQARDETARDPN